MLLIEPSSCSCSRDRVGEPKSGWAVPDDVLVSCALMALMTELKSETKLSRALVTEVVSLTIWTWTVSGVVPVIGEGASSWNVTPGMTVVTVFEATETVSLPLMVRLAVGARSRRVVGQRSTRG